MAGFRALVVRAWVVVAFGLASAPAHAAPVLREAELLGQLRALGVTVQIGGSCGSADQLAVYNMGANWLCLGDALQEGAEERSKVLHHELVHVVQDCLDGLATPTSLALAEGLRSIGTLSQPQLNGFFLQYLRNQGNVKHVVAATALLPQESRQREIEAYALQADPELVQHLFRQSCQLS